MYKIKTNQILSFFKNVKPNKIKIDLFQFDFFILPRLSTLLKEPFPLFKKELMTPDNTISILENKYE